MWNRSLGTLSTAGALFTNGILTKNLLDAAPQSAGDFIDRVQSCALAGRFKLVRKRFGNSELFCEFGVAQLSTRSAEFFGKGLSDRIWHSCFIGEMSSIFMDDLSCLHEALAHFDPEELPMSANLSFPIRAIYVTPVPLSVVSSACQRSILETSRNSKSSLKPRLIAGRISKRCDGPTDIGVRSAQAPRVGGGKGDSLNVWDAVTKPLLLQARSFRIRSFLSKLGFEQCGSWQDKKVE